MNAIYIVGAILIVFGIAVLSQTGLLTSSQMVYYPFVGTSLFIIGVVLCYVEYTLADLKISGLTPTPPQYRNSFLKFINQMIV